MQDAKDLRLRKPRKIDPVLAAQTDPKCQQKVSYFDTPELKMWLLNQCTKVDFITIVISIALGAFHVKEDIFSSDD